MFGGKRIIKHQRKPDTTECRGIIIRLHSVKNSATKRNVTQLSGCTTVARNAALKSQEKTLISERCAWSSHAASARRGLGKEQKIDGGPDIRPGRSRTRSHEASRSPVKVYSIRSFGIATDPVLARESLLASWFIGFWFLGFWFQSFLVPKFLAFLVSKILTYL